MIHISDEEREKHTADFLNAFNIVKKSIEEGYDPPEIIVKYKYVFDKSLDGYRMLITTDIQDDILLPARGGSCDSRQQEHCRS